MKRLLSLLLTAALALGLCSAPASAAGTSGLRIAEAVPDYRNLLFLDEKGDLLRENGTLFLSGVAEVRGDVSGGAALKTDGTVWAWGQDWHTPNGTVEHRPYLPEQLAGGAADCDRKGEYTMVVKEDGAVLLHGVEFDQEWVTMAEGVKEARLGAEITFADFPTVAVLDDRGSLDIVTYYPVIHTFETLHVADGISSIAYFSGMHNGGGVNDEYTLYVYKNGGELWGYVYYDEEGIGDPVPAQALMGADPTGDGPLYAEKVMDPGVVKVIRPAAYGEVTAALRDDGTLWAWGNVKNTVLSGLSGDSKQFPPTQSVEVLSTPTQIGQDIVDIAGSNLLVTLDETGTVRRTNGVGWDESFTPETTSLSSAFLPGSVTYTLGDQGSVTFRAEGETFHIQGVFTDPNVTSAQVSYWQGFNLIPLSEHALPAAGQPFDLQIPIARFPTLDDIAEAGFAVGIDWNHTGWPGLSRHLGVSFLVDPEQRTIELVNSYPESYLKNETLFRGQDPSPFLEDALIVSTSNAIVGDAADDFEKYMRIHQWLGENITYRISDENGNRLPNDPHSVLTSKHCCCEGFSRTEVALLLVQGIPASYVASGSDNHAWDMMYIHNQWYVSDATWDVGGRLDWAAMHPANAGRAFAREDQFLQDAYFRIDGMRRASTPSPWAQAEVDAAVASGVVPVYCRSYYKDAMTREDFCRLIVCMVRKAGGETVFDFTYSPQAKALQTRFADTKTSDVLCAYDMGIVTGKSEDRFDPTGRITRQEAAAMLQRAAEYLKVPAGGGPEAFADAASIPDWAKAGVDFISGLTTPAGAKVMGGTGDGNFTPAGTYTTEQAILSVYRLYQAAVG